MRGLLIGLTGLASLVVLSGYLGRVHPLGDSFAVLRPVSVSVLAFLSLALFLARVRAVAMAGLALAGLSALSMFPAGLAALSAAEDARAYRLYQKNLLWILPDTGVVADDIRAAGADFVTLQELHRRNRPILADLRETYPYQHFCPFAAVGGIAVLSRWPPAEGGTRCDDGYGFAAMQVVTPDGPLWVVALHLHWPYPYGQARQVEALLPRLATLDAPIVVGGDFNMVPWSYSVREIARTTGSDLAGYAGGTFQPSYRRNGRDLAGWMPPLPIDHVLVPEAARDVTLDRRDRLGSDHHGLLARFSIDAPSP